VVSLEDYRRITAAEPDSLDDLTVRDIATQDVVTVFPDESVGTALRRMAPRDLSRMPVVARDDPRRLLGVVRRNDIVRAYEVGVLRREEARHRAEAISAVNHSRAEFVEVHISPGSHAASHTIAELELPRPSVLVSIRRGRELVIPHGDTRLEPGDVVTALCERECTNQVQAALTRAD
jgi:CIC family chloride channel protein